VSDTDTIREALEALQRKTDTLGHYERMESLALISNITAALARLEAERDELLACGCVPCVFASGVCHKCGRIATFTQEHFLEIVKTANRAEAAEAQVGSLTEALRRITTRHPDAKPGEHPAVDIARAALAGVAPSTALDNAGILWVAALDRVPIEERIEWVETVLARVDEINAQRAGSVAPEREEAR
jgi:hypothetical protein